MISRSYSTWVLILYFHCYCRRWLKITIYRSQYNSHNLQTDNQKTGQFFLFSIRFSWESGQENRTNKSLKFQRWHEHGRKMLVLPEQFCAHLLKQFCAYLLRSLITSWTQFLLLRQLILFASLCEHRQIIYRVKYKPVARFYPFFHFGGPFFEKNRFFSSE